MDETEIDNFYDVFCNTKVVTLAAMMNRLSNGHKGIVLSEIAVKAGHLTDKVVKLYDILSLNPEYLPEGFAREIEVMRTSSTLKTDQLKEEISGIWGSDWNAYFGHSTGRDRLYAIKAVAQVS
jgi:hypothetical protein